LFSSHPVCYIFGNFYGRAVNAYFPHEDMIYFQPGATHASIFTGSSVPELRAGACRLLPIRHVRSPWRHQQ
jgi:hypothetical protein